MDEPSLPVLNAEGQEAAWFQPAKRMARRRGIASTLIDIHRSEAVVRGVICRDATGQVLLVCSWRSLGMPCPSELLSSRRSPLEGDGALAACWLLPVSALIGLVLQAIPIVNFLLRGLVIWCHEFGHAFVAWFSGRRALPLPLGWTSFSNEREFVVLVLLLHLEIVLLVMGLVSRRRVFTLFAISLIALQLLGWFALPLSLFWILMSWGGVAGEFIVPTVLLVLTLFPLPQYFNWSVLRVPTQLASSYVLVHALVFWHQVASGRQAVPYGSLWNPSHGDLDALIGSGWTEARIIESYVWLGAICVVILVSTVVTRLCTYWLRRH